MGYIPHTAADTGKMLASLGLQQLDDLFSHIPKELRAKPMKIDAGLPEMPLTQHMAAVGSANRRLTIFAGAGAYDHFSPPAVNDIISHGKFFSAYTPYQPEASQGLLQCIYEYQTMIASLTGMAAANASMYDGATALYEACVLASRHTGRTQFAISRGVNPVYRETMKSLGHNLDFTFVEFDAANPNEAGANVLNDQCAAVIAQSPDFYGKVHDLSALFAAAHKVGALAVASAHPISLAVFKDPGAMGADLAAGEAQPLGVPVQFGGPYVGYLAASQALFKKLPGRLVGQTVDKEGARAFTLTLQAREQHIRRERATSNICTNQGLCALMAWAYLTLVGKNGLKQAAELNIARATQLRAVLAEVPGVQVSTGALFNEFTYSTPHTAVDVLAGLRQHGILGGVAVHHRFGKAQPAADDKLILTAATEKRTPQEIANYAAALKAVLAGK